MSALPAYLQDLVTGPAVIAALAGIVIGRVLGGFARRAPARNEEVDRQFRNLDAELRVAQKTIEQQRADLGRAADEARLLQQELATLREQSGTREERLRRLKSELQFECKKTATLRQELADRAEEMVRTHVQIRDIQNELGVARVGSDVILEQIARLEQERDDLNGLVGSLRDELVARAASSPGPGGTRDPVLGS